MSKRPAYIVEAGGERAGMERPRRAQLGDICLLPRPAVDSI